jgi:hypothetical protein
VAGGRVPDADRDRYPGLQVLEHVGFLVEIGQQGAFQA